MMHHRVRVRKGLGVLVFVLSVVACSSHSTGPSAPLGPEDYCRSPCTPAKGHPCGNPDHSACVADCVARIQDRTDACRDCILQYSGWHGTTCSCDGALGALGSFTCTGCGWSGNAQGCGTNFSNCGGDGAKTCTGYAIVTADNPLCAAKCGVAPAADGGSDAEADAGGG